MQLYVLKLWFYHCQDKQLIKYYQKQVLHLFVDHLSLLTYLHNFWSLINLLN
ncbi:hypothetical protein SAMN05421740_11394 [Parapedobacter koreensis]|uniref:Uncharacterized protein n=1 Tax=Parapedobacter koreensis TaxID=332977 RepID=A0A1H7U4D5_9SPHI|nr:hypothetical protein SAMN05421740_11394 [Parapedobacter koreensis]